MCDHRRALGCPNPPSVRPRAWIFPFGIAIRVGCFAGLCDGRGDRSGTDRVDIDTEDSRSRYSLIGTRRQLSRSRRLCLEVPSGRACSTCEPRGLAEREGFPPVALRPRFPLSLSLSLSFCLSLLPARQCSHPAHSSTLVSRSLCAPPNGQRCPARVEVAPGQPHLSLALACEGHAF